MAIDFLICTVDIDEMRNGEQLGMAIRDGKEGGIPWFVFLDPTQEIFRTNPENGELSRNEAAILATSDGPSGNVGCPITFEERQHFLACLDSSRVNLSNEQLLRIDEMHTEFAGKKEEKDALKVGSIPSKPPSYNSLDDSFLEYRKLYFNRKRATNTPSQDFSVPPEEKFYSDFRSLAKNYLAPPNDRGQATMWCLKYLLRANINWRNARAVHNSLAIKLINNWSNADWATRIPEAISNSPFLVDNHTEGLLLSLEASTNKTIVKEAAAFEQVARLQYIDDSEFLSKAQWFLEKYPQSKYASRAKAFLKNAKLVPGETAPNFTGQSVDGVDISLSDYKGKVTYLVFWGFW